MQEDEAAKRLAIGCAGWNKVVGDRKMGISQTHVYPAMYLFWLDPIFDLQIIEKELLMVIFSALIKIIMQSITTLGAGETQELFLLSLSFTTQSVIQLYSI